ncbi:hypothetical protein [Parahaliea aestuarii]|uniref:Uncharacterized protein n=1 Tax=Parahaliea aestuarii TaxID=1852021 RepID=A0A5C8ZPH5_9GAMM|nr:hypothetical protein [Parahaliea aestuarii]TXS89674.1 hypothetical protein FVW59_16815 [Parahaliea aestuarii]
MRRLILFCCCLVATGGVAASGEDGPALPDYVHYAAQEARFGSALDSGQLGELRGGFTTSDGLQFAFSMEQVTHLNGEALSQVSVVMPVFGLAGNTATMVRGADALSQASAAGSFSLSGLPGASPAAGLGLPMLIQNALDNQHIENLTLINLDIFGTDTLRGGMIHQLVETTSIQSLRP